MASAKKQTLLLTCVNTVVRAIGLAMRVFFSRLLGAEIMGIVELASGVHMIAITPLTSGLPLAVSRMTAKAGAEKRTLPLSAALYLARMASFVLIPALLLLSPFIAGVMHDARVLPSLWMSAPCILILGYSAAYNGYCYGTDQSWLPAMSELIEQATRFAVAVGLILWLRRLTAAWSAAIPVFATMVAEILGLVFVLGVLRLPLAKREKYDSFIRPVFRLSAPTTLSRLIATGLRSLTAMLLPVRLQFSGLSSVEATARLGMLNGMVLPIVMLPCIFTSALSMVMLPRFARVEKQPAELRGLLRSCLGSTFCVGAACAGLIYLCAPFLAVRIYRLAELTALFRLSSLLAIPMSLSHVTAGVVAGFGRQKQAMYGALASSCVSLLLTWLLTGLPTLRLSGAIIALGAGQVVTLAWNLGIIFARSRDAAAAADDKSV